MVLDNLQLNSIILIITIIGRDLFYIHLQCPFFESTMENWLIWRDTRKFNFSSS